MVSEVQNALDRSFTSAIIGILDSHVAERNHSSDMVHSVRSSHTCEHKTVSIQQCHHVFSFDTVPSTPSNMQHPTEMIVSESSDKGLRPRISLHLGVSAGTIHWKELQT